MGRGLFIPQWSVLLQSGTQHVQLDPDINKASHLNAILAFSGVYPRPSSSSSMSASLSVLVAWPGKCDMATVKIGASSPCTAMAVEAARSTHSRRASRTDPGSISDLLAERKANKRKSLSSR
eukprot:CAMPEP_0194750642 /NCGR_PEP_ID=MMETSP0323_2-20130528/4746_1 /TAXON_ID=2866 ORGANISM="Crypthecodinium cohnii, Strain Seligo" /NCGR_SAMPLE_ID=MMETSP0323_2 /ASSEMBLY_ACC=CAM_ASM_000346 /LENGTH=121 /DNA_ID=CAMNT_0039666581 /DNA_START=260 /DNA_END=621 /DNA_ORIENTATION=+